ncbi:ribose-5-phosphate isomerase RpiA [Chitinophaga sp. Cy-1792]|uniref:ribose-5-phosphate isomerase RpiA n=1 Tax=Chitinophaga sp. Cy-1792 TaxID=2608339 RepID=UPI00141EC301|nr:ribose-5-phosphate isomerase RpiA [Chitinophaga sp. Cy-1792]NIG55193.1 ribose-5-phosphate isomerase RpiA [Chitinophaga sp. Cy-1792]
MQINIAKKAAAEEAAKLVRTGMTVGLGTGSTAYYAIIRLGEMVRNEGLIINAVATSEESDKLAREQGIPMVPFSEVQQIDIDIDGADESDASLRLIKGGGGALLREKIIAAASDQMIVIADEAKLVNTLGKFPLPVEIIPFAHELTMHKLKELGGAPVIRHKSDKVFITDNGNYIADCYFEEIPDPETLHAQLNGIPGVVENGLFIGLATTLIVGNDKGEVQIYHR